jgi:alkylation response protein AidB-like acyl-CoA dehydrogenase
VFSTPDVRVCGTLSPTGVAERRPGGVVLNGKWGFISGARHSHWQEIIAVILSPDGPPEPIMALVPMSDLEIADDWYSSGLCGSGSVSTIASDVFIPEERVLSLGAVLHEQYSSTLNADLPMYRAPLLGVAAATTVGTVIGLAKGALELFFERLPGRKITYTSYDSQQDAPVTHLQVAEAALKTDEAEFHGFRVADLVDSKGLSGEPWTMLERARARADVGAVSQLGKQAVDILSNASGGSSIYRSVPIQRIARDVQAINLHALINPATNQELYGRVLSGLEPNTFYI